MLKKIKRFPNSPGLARLIASLAIACLLSLTLLIGCAPTTQDSQAEISLSALPQTDVTPSPPPGFQMPSFPYPRENPSPDEAAPSPDFPGFRFPSPQEKAPTGSQSPASPPLQQEPPVSESVPASEFPKFKFPAFLSFSSNAPGLDTFIEAWNILFEDYVDRGKLDAEKLSQAAIKGMIEAVDDPYTSYLSPEDYKQRLESIKREYQGIGAWVMKEEEQIIIVRPFPNSPAEKAGIREGDKVLMIDGESTEGMSVDEAVLRIKGPAGTSVTLLILHKGESEPVEITIVRAEIKVQSVEFEMRSGFAYIKVLEFSERTAEEFVDALREAREEEARGIILDLRNNPGGSLQVVIDVADELLDGGVVLYIVDNKGERRALSAQPGGLATDLPLVVLVNKYSASGSEVLAGALRDHGRAKLAGSKTFGKGSVTVIRPLRDGSALNITSSRYFTPEGHPVEGVGLEPDFPLDLEGEDLVDWAIDYLHSQIPQGVLVGQV